MRRSFIVIDLIMLVGFSCLMVGTFSDSTDAVGGILCMWIAWLSGFWTGSTARW